MLELIVRSVIILAAAWAVAASLGRATAATRHLVWHLAIVAVLVAPLVQPLAPVWPITVPAALRDAVHATGALVTPPPDAVRALESSGDGMAGAEVAGSAALARPAAAPPRPGAPPLSLVWGAGSIVLTLWYAVGWAVAARARRRAAAAPAAWQVEVNALRDRLRITPEVELRIADGPISPMAIGVWQSAVLLPAAAHAWDTERRRAVLLHELAHIARRDCRVQLIAQAASVVYWFNPLVWKAAAALRAERERACDDEVLRWGARPSDYATSLLEIARDLRPRLVPSAALTMARPSELEGRLLAILASGRTRVPARHSRSAVALVMTALSAAALAAVPAPIAATGEAVAAAPLRAARSSYLRFVDFPPVVRGDAADRIAAQASAILSDSPDARAREDAVAQLIESGAETLDLLQRALADSDRQVRERAALGLALLSTDDAVPPLLQALGDPDAQVREKAAMGLMLRRHPLVVDALLAAAADPDAQVREKVVLALATSGDPRARPALETALDDPDAQVREKAITGLRFVP